MVISIAHTSTFVSPLQYYNTGKDHQRDELCHGQSRNSPDPDRPIGGCHHSDGGKQEMKEETEMTSGQSNQLMVPLHLPSSFPCPIFSPSFVLDLCFAVRPILRFSGLLRLSQSHFSLISWPPPFTFLLFLSLAPSLIPSLHCIALSNPPGSCCGPLFTFLFFISHLFIPTDLFFCHLFLKLCFHLSIVVFYP